MRMGIGRRVVPPAVPVYPLTVRKKVAVDLFEFFRAQVTRWTVLEEAFVPSLDFLVGELCVLAQVFQHFRLEFAVLFSHCAWICSNGARVVVRVRLLACGLCEWRRLGVYARAAGLDFGLDAMFWRECYLKQ